MKITKDDILNIFFPEHYKCIICGREISAEEYDICPSCRPRLPWLVGHKCIRCGQKIQEDNNFCDNCKKPHKWYYTMARSPLRYTESIVVLVHGLKYSNRKFLARPMAEIMCDCLASTDFDCDVIVPVPMSDKKRKSRGYNQAELIAKEIADITTLPLDTTTLIRTKEVDSQVALSATSRKSNVEGCFKSNRNLKGKNVLLVDDVYTTGATVNECSKMLIEHGKVESVYVITFAHSIEKSDIDKQNNS